MKLEHFGYVLGTLAIGSFGLQLAHSRDLQGHAYGLSIYDQRYVASLPQPLKHGVLSETCTCWYDSLYRTFTTALTYESS